MGQHDYLIGTALFEVVSHDNFFHNILRVWIDMLFFAPLIKLRLLILEMEQLVQSVIGCILLLLILEIVLCLLVGLYLVNNR